MRSFFHLRLPVNTVLPDLVFGRIHDPTPGFYSSGSNLQTFADGEPNFWDSFFHSPCWFVDVEDVAKLHVSALLDDSVNGQRIWAATGPLSAFDVQEGLQKVKPDYKARDISAHPSYADVVIDNQASSELLKKHYGSGFNDLKSTLRANVS